MNQTALAPVEQVQFGKASLQQLREIIKSRPDKLVIKGKQYLEFSDWQTLGAFAGITAYVEMVEPWNVGETKEFVGFHATARAVRNGEIISRAEAICLFNEPNFKGKPQNYAYSMAQTRACRKALSTVLLWIVKLPQSGKGEPVVAAAPEDEQADVQPGMFEEGG